MREVIYTKQGHPFKLSGKDFFSRYGKHVARIQDEKAYNPDGKYERPSCW